MSVDWVVYEITCGETRKLFKKLKQVMIVFELKHYHADNK